MNFYFFSFEVTHLQNNINRWYEMRIGTDLFEKWYILISWGRKGYRGGQKKRYVFNSLEETIEKAIAICKRRLNATSRIGCNYTCTNYPLTLGNVEKIFKSISCDH